MMQKGREVNGVGIKERECSMLTNRSRTMKSWIENAAKEDKLPLRVWE